MSCLNDASIIHHTCFLSIFGQIGLSLSHDATVNIFFPLRQTGIPAIPISACWSACYLVRVRRYLCFTGLPVAVPHPLATNHLPSNLPYPYWTIPLAHPHTTPCFIPLAGLQATSFLPMHSSRTQHDVIVRPPQGRLDARALQHPPDRLGMDFRSNDKQWSFQMVIGDIAN